MRPAPFAPPPRVVVATIGQESLVARLVTGVVSNQYAPVAARYAGRSLSKAHGSVDVPMVNSPAGTSTSAGRSAERSGWGAGAGGVTPGRLSDGSPRSAA